MVVVGCGCGLASHQASPSTSKHEKGGSELFLRVVPPLWSKEYLQCWMLNASFLMWSYVFLGETHQFGAKHLTKDLVQDVVLWSTLVCHNISGGVGSNFSELHAKWRYQLCVQHPAQLRATRLRVGCDDTPKKWVWSCDLYFWGLGWCMWWGGTRKVTTLLVLLSPSSSLKPQHSTINHLLKIRQHHFVYKVIKDHGAITP
jgi:hypothetical protein